MLVLGPLTNSYSKYKVINIKNTTHLVLVYTHKCMREVIRSFNIGLVYTRKRSLCHDDYNPRQWYAVHSLAFWRYVHVSRL